MSIQNPVGATILAEDPAQPCEPGLAAYPGVPLRARG